MAHAKAGRNDLCPCGSGKKYKKCCEARQQAKSRGNLLMFVLVAVLLAAGLAFAVTSFTTDDVARPTGVWSPEHGHYH